MIRTLETFDARIYTSTFRAYGTIHLPPEQTTEALLNAMARQLLPVTDPLIYAPGTDHPPSQGDLKVSAGFLAVHYDQIDWIVGGRPPKREPSCGAWPFSTMGMSWSASCAFRERPGLRISWRRRRPFRRCSRSNSTPGRRRPAASCCSGATSASLFEVGALQVADDPVVTLEARQRFPFATVNLRRVTGVLEAPGSPEPETRSEALN